jgi:alpha-ketoglutarate-dependent taurine dioxygenase
LEEESEYYAALAAFETILGDPAAKYEFLMQEGDLVLFDNRRVLHARREFRDLNEEERAAKGVEIKDGEPTRWLKGLYLDGEVVWDKLVTLQRDLQTSSRHDA